MPKIRANMRESHADRFISLQAGAQTYGVSVDTLRRRVSDGALPAYRCGRLIRVKVSDLDALFRPIPTVKQAG